MLGSSNKDRLYVGLYARSGAATMPGKEDTYHWALIIGPKNEKEGAMGLRYHVKNQPKVGGGSEWVFEEVASSLYATSMLLVRLRIGKVINSPRLGEILRNVPIRNGKEGWNCVSWVKEALEIIEADQKVMGTSILHWYIIRDEAMDYCQRKKDQHRFDGEGDFDTRIAPTFDFMENKETTE